MLPPLRQALVLAAEMAGRARSRTRSRIEYLVDRLNAPIEPWVDGVSDP